MKKYLIIFVVNFLITNSCFGQKGCGNWILVKDKLFSFKVPLEDYSKMEFYPSIAKKALTNRNVADSIAYRGISEQFDCLVCILKHNFKQLQIDSVSQVLLKSIKEEYSTESYITILSDTIIKEKGITQVQMCAKG